MIIFGIEEMRCWQLHLMQACNTLMINPHQPEQSPLFVCSALLSLETLQWGQTLYEDYAENKKLNWCCFVNIKVEMTKVADCDYHRLN